MTDNSRVKVKADDITGGKALFAAYDIPEAGQLVVSELVPGSRVLKEPTKYTIRKDDDVHLDIKTIIKYANHSFQPNVRVVFPSTPREDEKKDDEEDHLVVFESIGPIAAGEEIMFDYTSTEQDFACPFIDHVTNRWVGTPRD